MIINIHENLDLDSIWLETTLGHFGFYIFEENWLLYDNRGLKEKQNPTVFRMHDRWSREMVVRG